MLYLSFRISNPFAKESWDSDVWVKAYSISKNKILEIQYMRSAVLFEIGFSWTHQTDHAGVRLELGLLGQEIDIAFEDGRHWDSYLNCWEAEKIVNPEDEDKFQELVTLLGNMKRDKENGVV